MAERIKWQECEWTDRFGAHWEVSLTVTDGRTFTRKLTKHRLLGWPDRSAAREELLQAMKEATHG